MKLTILEMIIINKFKANPWYRDKDTCLILVNIVLRRKNNIFLHVWTSNLHLCEIAKNEVPLHQVYLFFAIRFKIYSVILLKIYMHFLRKQYRWRVNSNAIDAVIEELKQVERYEQKRYEHRIMQCKLYRFCEKNRIESIEEWLNGKGIGENDVPDSAGVEWFWSNI